MHDWEKLLARCERWRQGNDAWQRSQGHEVGPDRMVVTFEPATEAQVARAEARLEATLPPSLRSFYLHSNGYGAVGNFIWSVRSLEQLSWLRGAEPEFYDSIYEDDAAVARSLVVSREGDASWWLLDPGNVNDRGEWRAGRWSSWNPGIEWKEEDFFELFEGEVAGSEQLLARKVTIRVE